MASNSLPNQVKIAIKRRKSPTNSSPIPTASHKKIKKSIANVKLEFGHILDKPVLKQKSPKNKTKSPSSNLPFILPPLKKRTLDTKVIRPKIGEPCAAGKNYASTLSRVSKHHFDINYEKNTTTSTRLRSKSPTPLVGSSSTSSTSSTSSAMLVLHNHQRCFVEDFMVLPVEKPCIILIPVANNALVTRYSNLINSIMDKATVQFGDDVFFHVCHCRVIRNVDLGKLESNQFTQVDMKDALFSNLNSGVTVATITSNICNDNESIYIVFDKLLLIAQKCLKWKCIYPTKISNCYRLAKAMSDSVQSTNCSATCNCVIQVR